MKLWKIIFIIWIAFWLLFLVRGFAKGEFEDFIALYRLNAAEKNFYILGEDLALFLDVCKNKIPETGRYKIIGDIDEHDRFRLIYHLYPRQESEEPQYLLKIYASRDLYSIEQLR